MKEETNWREYAGPSDYDPEAVESALRSIDDVVDERSMRAAYNRVLFAVGNNHAGTLYPAALPAMARVAEHLRSEGPWVRRAAGEILVELLAFEFHPDFAPLPMDGAVAAKLLRLRPFKMAIIRARERVDSDDYAADVFDDLLAQLDAPVKDYENELPVAEVWRPMIERVVQRFAKGDYALGEGVPEVAPVSAETATQIREYVEDYGATLVALDPETWDSSVSRWMGDKWEVLVDLWTEEEGPSDMVLHLYVR